MFKKKRMTMPESLPSKQVKKNDLVVGPNSLA